MLGVRDGIPWVNDSISTTPHASLAALDAFRDRRVALLAGGHDRGLDWAGFADEMKSRAAVAIVAMGPNGAAIHALLPPSAVAACTPLDPCTTTCWAHRWSDWVH